LNQAGNLFMGHILDVALAAANGINLALVWIHTNDGETGFSHNGCQGQAYVTQTQDCYPSLACFQLLDKILLDVTHLTSENIRTLLVAG
jgi:hypothetical protein